MRSDPSDTGGLFVGRRPGTSPLLFRSEPERKGSGRQRADRAIANLLFGGMVLLCLCCWVPIPIACLWIGSEIDYLTGSVGLGILLAFVGLAALLFGALSILKRMDYAWILVRRAAGYDQRTGVLGRIFAVTVVICAGAFLFWFIVIHGPGSSISSGNRP